MKRTGKSDARATRMRAEVWDQMQFFFQEYNDHQLHAAISFGGRIDRDIIRKAVFLSMERVPLLGSKFVLNNFRPHWEKAASFSDEEVVSFVDTINPAEEIDKFLVGMTNELTGPQVAARVVAGESKDTLCIILNHMVCDGSAFKEYLYFLAGLYTELQTGQGSATRYRDGDRSPKQIYRHMGMLDRVRVFLLPSAYKKDGIVFPLRAEDRKGCPFIARQTLIEERFAALKEYGRQHGATVNDIILAAYFRALHKTLDLRLGEALTIPCMADLRRYLPSGTAGAFCNLTGNIVCRIGSDIGSDLGQTVAKVAAETKAQKEHYPGLAGLSTLYALFRLLPFSSLRKWMKEGFPNPLIGMTNIGIIDPERLVFGKTEVEQAFVTGSIKYPPYFQLALTSFKDVITFAIAEYGTKEDRERIEQFLRVLDGELERIG